VGVVSSYTPSNEEEPAVRCMLLSEKMRKFRDLHRNQKLRISNPCQHRKTKYTRDMGVPT
jgi:hypothetical protein